MLVEALKIAAGDRNFRPGDRLDIPEKEARELVADGAVRIIEQPKPKAPARQSSKTSQASAAKE